MVHLRVTISLIDEEYPDGVGVELSRTELPKFEIAKKPGRGTLEAIEEQTLSIGHEVMRQMLISQWEIADQEQVIAYCESCESGKVQIDGFASQRVASRLGILELRRQVCFNLESETHLMPGNELLPDHNGTIITRGLQEWACLLSQDLPFATVERLLGWQTHQAKVICGSEVQVLVRRHGEAIRGAEAQEVESLEGRDDLNQLKANLLDPKAARHHAAWPVELTAAVEQALAQGNKRPPQGVSIQDWERVLLARETEAECFSLGQLRCLGPEVQQGQVIAATDDVLVRKPQSGQWLTQRVARIATPNGYRYLSGTGSLVLRQIALMLVLCGGLSSLVTLLGDGAKWLRDFFEAGLKDFTQKEFLLDWYHLLLKCKGFAGMICSTKQAKRELKKQLGALLWKGETELALEILETYRCETKNEEKLQELIDYLTARKPYIVNYNERRLLRQYIGSAHAEKACDLIVAKRQKNRGMHWSERTADGLAALKTVMLNKSWDLYWKQHKVLPLAVAP
jgi:hypothetical protein